MFSLVFDIYGTCVFMNDLTEDRISFNFNELHLVREKNRYEGNVVNINKW